MLGYGCAARLLPGGHRHRGAQDPSHGNHIRTMVVKDGQATVQAAAGVVADSTPEEEFLETRNKASAVLQAMEAAR